MLRSLLAALVCLLAVGCSSKLSSQVSGQVTLDGAPLTSGDVTFAPVGDGQIAYGKIDANGKYSLSTGNEAGAQPGDYVVTVVATGTPPANDKPPPLLTPAKYSDKATSDLKKTVTAGTNTIDLPLTK